MKILLATDGSKSAEAAVDFLIRFPFPKDSEVTVLTVLHRDLFGEDEPATSMVTAGSPASRVD